VGKTLLNHEEAFSKFDGKYGIVLTEGGDCRIVRFDDDELNLIKPHELRKFTAHRRTRIDDKIVPAFQYWFEHPEADRYAGLTFDPSKAPVPLPSKDGERRYNLWRGWAFNPRPGTCDRFLAHVRNVICGGDDGLFTYLESWLANLFQDPTERPGVAIVLRGGQGVGKGVFASTIGRLLAPAHYLHIASPDLLVGRFTAHFAGKLLLFADESFWAGDKGAEGRLKALITEENLTVEPKGHPPFTIRNLVRLIIASNETWIVPANLDERRYLVLDVSSDHRNDHQYFAAIFQELRNGGYEALLHHFLNEVDSTRLNLREVPQTEALFEQKLEGADSVLKFWYYAWQDGSLFEECASQGWISKVMVYDEYRQSAVKTRWKESAQEFWRKTKVIFGEIPEKRLKRSGVRIRAVKLPELDGAKECLVKAFTKGLRF